jgi:hypothetical protein
LLDTSTCDWDLLEPEMGSSLFQVGLVIKWMWSRRGGLTGGVIVSLAA